MQTLRDQILAVLDDEFRPCAEIAKRAKVDKTRAAPALGYMRQSGAVECTRHGQASLWRRAQWSSR